MSIQVYTTKKNLLNKFVDYYKILLQIIFRLPNYGGVFFRYKTRYTHPLHDRYYIDPPIAWSNYFSAKILHWVNYPKFIDKRFFIIEINDHPLSVIGLKYNVYEPYLTIKHIDFAKEIFSHPNCKCIIMTCNGMKKLFNYYFSTNLDYKIIILAQPGCIPQKAPNNKLITSPISFLCLASDYYTKGLDIVLKSWRKIKNKNNSLLFIACGNIPEDEYQKIIKDNSIKLVTSIPLSNSEKEVLLSCTQVSIASTHIHGGGNILEGLEYGHALIYFEYHVDAFEKFGKKIKMPYYFYKPDCYGIEWKTFSEFKQKLIIDKQNGVFDESINTLTNMIKYYIDNPNITIADRKEAYKYATLDLSYKFRKESLQTLYSKILYV